MCKSSYLLSQEPQQVLQAPQIQKLDFPSFLSEEIILNYCSHCGLQKNQEEAYCSHCGEKC